MTKKSYITFDQAARAQSPAAFSTMVKPAGSACNMSCGYCYYLDKKRLYGSQPIMNQELLELYIKQYIEANEVEQVSFIWHGGEPLICGIDFYEKAIELQKKYGAGRIIENSLQTNGLLLDDKWSRFFAENNFLIGVSIDGPKEVHDHYRKTRGGEETFTRVVKGIKSMYDHGVEYNTLSVVSAASAGKAVEIYEFLKGMGTRYMQFLPALEHTKDGLIAHPAMEGSEQTGWSVSADDYGQFLCDIFDLWIRNDVGEYFVQMFDVTLAGWYGIPAGLCSFSEYCGEALAVEHNGDVYCCDHFVYPEYKLGNIKERTLSEMFKSPQRVNFGISKENTLTRECRVCEFGHICRGECPKHRFSEKNALCDGFKLFFKHSQEYMKRMCQLLDDKKPPAEIMKDLFFLK